MPSSNQTVLCRYHYDPLDRLASCSPAASDSIQRFYQKSRLTTEIQGQIQRSIVQCEDRLLAQQTRRADLTECALLGTDQQRSVLNTAEHLQVAYTPYGTRQPLLDLPGFNGEQPDPVTGHYLLGNGYRAFNPVLMRFNSPDSLSPFGGGGINVYAYCAGDPVNRVDPTGHTWMWFKLLFRSIGVMKPSSLVASVQLLHYQQKNVLMVTAQTQTEVQVQPQIQPRSILKQTSKTVSFADEGQGSGLVYRGNAQDSASAGSSYKARSSKNSSDASAATMSASRSSAMIEPSLVSRELQGELAELRLAPVWQRVIKGGLTQDELAVADIYLTSGRLEGLIYDRVYNRQQLVSKLNANIRRDQRRNSYPGP
jgi:RHS repeat-associated protein